MKTPIFTQMKKAVALVVTCLLFSGAMYAQQKTSIAVKDLDSDIEKYIDKNYKDYKTTEAYKYAAVYEMKIKKEATVEVLVFDKEGKFLYKKTEADKAKVSNQTRTTMTLEDVEGDITKYIKKNYEGWKLMEAFVYHEVYTTKIMKGAASEALVFDKEGNFVMKVKPATAATPVPPTPAATPAVVAPAVVAAPIDGPPPAQSPTPPVQKTDSVPKR